MLNLHNRAYCNIFTFYLFIDLYTLHNYSLLLCHTTMWCRTKPQEWIVSSITFQHHNHTKLYKEYTTFNLTLKVHSLVFLKRNLYYYMLQAIFPALCSFDIWCGLTKQGRKAKRAPRTPMTTSVSKVFLHYNDYYLLQLSFHSVAISNRRCKHRCDIYCQLICLSFNTEKNEIN
jgi:hypothetical protein